MQNKIYIKMYEILLFLLTINAISTEDVYFEIYNKEISNISDIFIPSNVTVCEIYLTEIEIIPANYFFDLPQIQYLYLGENQIYKVEPFSFYNVPSIRWLYLNLNQIEILTENMLAGMSELRRLFFQHNKIHIIENHFFCNLSELAMVDLSNNNLKIIQIEAFDPQNYKHVVKLIIHSNPIRCVKCWCWARDANWMTIRRVEDTYCSEPSHLAGHSWISICDLEIGCPLNGKKLCSH